MLASCRSAITSKPNLPVTSMIKSDRIHALKKQYDALLEEDKKRKERNEYILEKLDKMRYCTAVVQVRKKPGLIENADYYSSQKQHLGSLVPTVHQTLLPLKDESILLKEISKKYILIPKLRPIYTDNYAQDIEQNNDDNSDWKSKYDILEKLKKSEKEEEPYVSTETNLHEPERDTTEQVLNTSTTGQDGQPLFSYNQDPAQQQYNTIQPERETPYEGMNYLDNNNYLQNQPNVYHGNYNTQEPNNRDVNSDMVKLEDEGDNPQIIEYNHIALSKNNSDNINLTQNDTGPYISDNSNYKFDDTQYTSNNNEQNINENIDQMTKDNCLTVDDGLSIQTIHPSEFINEINNDINCQLKTNEIEELEYTNETINPQDFIPDDNGIQNIENITSDQFVTNDSNDVPNDNYVTSANDNMAPTVDLVDPSVVDGTESTEIVLEESNNEQYYSEQVDENYVYNQEGAENYTQEYTAPAENYQKEEYNTYYEGSQPHQGNGEVNENDETLQRYDQNYEQQYGTDYGGQQYEQQEYDPQYAQQGYDQQYVDQSQAEQVYSNQAQVQQYSDQEQADQNYTEQGQTQQHYTEQGQTEQHYADQGQTEQHFANQGQTEQHYADQGQTEQHYVDQGQTEQHYADQGQTEQHYADQGQTEQHYVDQAQREQYYADQGQTGQHYTDEGQTEQHYADQIGQHYSEQAHEEQYYTEQGQEYTQSQQEIGQSQAMYENNAPQFVEQKLDNEDGYIEKQNIETSKEEKKQIRQKNANQGKAP